MVHILIADDEPLILDITKTYLEKISDFTVDTAESAREALEMMESMSYGAIVSDYQMPEMDGIEFLKIVRGSGSNIVFIIFTGKGREDVVIEALNAGADFYLQKGGAPKSQFAELSHKIRHAVERKQAETRYETLFETSSAPLLITDREMRILMANPELEKLSGFSKEELEKKRWTEFIVEEDLGHMEEFSRRIQADPEGTPCNTECRVLDRSGECHNIYLTTAGMPDADAWITSFLDITDLKKVEEELAAAHRKMMDIIEFLPDATLVIDSDGRVIAWNRAIEVMTGVKAEDMIGKGDYEYAVPFYGERRPIMIDLVFAGEDELMRKEYSHIRREGNVLIADSTLPRPLGKKGVLMGTASPLYDSSGRMVGAIESIRDITERKAAERALEITNKKLQLLSGVTRHDILNQVTALAGYTDLLGDVLPDNPEMRNYIDRIAEVTSAIERQITFTRDYERLGVDPSQWQRVADIAERAASGCADRAINVSIATGALEVFTDPMLEKVFHNFFDNAVRHGEHVTEISVTCREEDEGGNAVIAVEDNGVGIPAEMKERIFKRGVGSNAGLGLFLVQEILVITGMSIRETGEEGKGACLEIIVPSGGWRGG